MQALKLILIFIGILLALGAIVAGSILPLLKSQSYIDAARNLTTFRSFAEFRQYFDRALFLYSPVGDEEVAKFSGSQVLRLVSNPEQPEPAARALTEYAESFLHKNDTRQLITLARMYSILWQRSGLREDVEKAEEYFQAARELGPNLPQPLYGLFDVYRSTGDTERLVVIGERILTLWPEDTQIEARLREAGQQ